MRTLYHYSLSPYSRKVRILLKEKDLEFELITENYWERRTEFLAMNPAGEVPLLVEDNEIYAEQNSICEYLEEKYPERNFIGKDINEHAEIRRLIGWFDIKFYNEVTTHILNERVIKCFKGSYEPNSSAIRAGRTNLASHLDYIAFLMKERRWLAGEDFSLADISAASQLSILDYLGDIPWEYSATVREWYSLVKSRPSFRPLLNDRIPGFKPPPYYADLDF